MFDDDKNMPWNLAAGTAFTGGAGYAFLKNKKLFQEAWNTANTDIIGQTVAQSQSLTGFNSLKNSMPGADIFDEAVQASVSAFERRAGAVESIANIHASTYQSLMSGGALTHKQALGAMSSINRQTSALGAYKAGLAAVQKYSGDISSFQANIQKLSTEQSVMSAISPGGFGGAARKGFSDINLLPAKAREHALRIQKRAADAFGLEGAIEWSYQNIDDVVAGKPVSTPMMIGQVGEDRLAAMPLAQTGVTYSSKNLNTRYVTRQGYDVTGRKMSFPEMYEESLIDAIQQSKTKAHLKQNVLDANQRLIDHMNMRDSGNRAAAIWASPYMTSGGMARARLTTQEAVMYGAMEEDDIINLFGKGLYPFTSPGAASKGTLSTRNLAEDLFGPLGAFASPSDRPTQFVRPEWGITGEAKSRATGFKGLFGQYYNRLDRKIQGPMYKQFMYGDKSPLSGQAYSAPQLTTFYAKPSRSGYGIGYQSRALNQMLAAEEGVISKSVTGMMEYERIMQKKVALDKGFMVNQNLASSLEGKKIGETVPLNIGAKEGFVGIERGTGKDILTGLDSNAGVTAIGAELTGKNEANVYLRERRKLSSTEMWKYFSEESKYMASAADETKMRGVLKAAGMGDRVNIAGQPIEAVFSGKLVGRNKMALLTQQIEATSMFVAQKIQSGSMQPTPEVIAFLENPTAAMNVKQLVRSAGSSAHTQIQRNLVGLAKNWQFNRDEMQLTFGLMSRDTLSDFAKSGTLSWREAGHIARSPGVVGLTKGMLGDIATEGGSGKWGTFEPSGFRALSMKGEIGQRYAAELTTRIAGKGELAAADKMAATVLGQESLFDKLARQGRPLESFMSGDIAQSEGRYVKLGRKLGALGGSDVMYIPGTLEAPELMQAKMAKGELIDTPLVKELGGFRRAMRDAEMGKITTEQLEEAAAGLRTSVVQQAESQASARGKIIGSKYLTGQRKTFAKDPGVFRISSATGEDMFGDLISRAQADDQIQFLQQQREAFRKGESITGGIWRHPTSGPESFQFVNFKKDANMVDGMLAAPTKFGKISFQDSRVLDVDVSEMVGMKGDFDKDQFTLSLISDRRTSDQARRAMNKDIREGYTQYLFNHYAMKDMVEGNVSKGAGLDPMVEGYRKLSTAKTTTGEVNIALQKLKLGVQYSKAEQYRPMAELFWHLEEAAIGGKHGVLEGDFYKSITQAVDEGGEKGTARLEGVIKTIMGDKPRTITGTMTDASGRVTQHSLKYEPRKWAETAISSYDSVSKEIDTAMKANAASRGRHGGGIALEEAVRMFHSRRTGSVDVTKTMMQANAGNINKFTMRASRAVMRGQVKARSLLSAAGRAKKPLLAGLGVAAGIMLMAPSTAGVMRNPEGANSGRNVDFENPDYVGGHPMNPPSPGMNMSPKIYDMGGGRRTSHANIRMRTDDLNSSSDDLMRSARQLSNGGSVNIRTKDDRSILDANSLARKIHERL